MAEKDDVLRILMQNSEKSFVKRILAPESFPTLDIGDGNVATHKMSWSEIDTPQGKKFVVYPKILFDGQRLADFGDAAMDHAVRTGNFISFDSPEKADWFSKRYKAAWE